MTVNYKKLNIMVKRALLVLPAFAVVALQPSDAHAADIITQVINQFGGVVNNVVNAIAGALNYVGSIFNQLGLGWLWNDFMNWLWGSGTCGQTVQGGIGDVMCNVSLSTNQLPGLITGISYMLGLMLAVIALVKLKDHVTNPDRTPLSDSMKRFVAGGAFFSLPAVTTAVQSLVRGQGDAQIDAYTQTGFSGAMSTTGGLDSMIFMLVSDIWSPMQFMLTSFAYLAGLVFVVIGIGRLIKTAQDGPRGPTSIGTIMTFVTAGVLFSLDSMMGAFSSSLFADNTVATYAMLSDTTGDALVDTHIEGVISAIIAFMALVGWISFIRGFFILRDVAEGNGQASLMAATTHMFGGALAVNLGPVMNAVQSTFGLTPFGVQFS